MRAETILSCCLAVLLALSLFPDTATAQTYPIGSLQDEQLRLHMLLNDSLSQNLVNRPYNKGNYEAFARSAERTGWWNRPAPQTETDLPGGFTLGAYSASFQNTFNSKLPYGENNAAAWYGKGMNSELLGGFWITSDYLTISIQPHIIYQQNRDFPVPRFVYRDEVGNLRFGSLRMNGTPRIDMPFRFGPDPYWTFDWGYSSIRLHYEEFEFGFSREPLWWGPMERYPLQLSNNAPGIPHAFLGTREPFKIPYVGSLQFRWIVGYPNESEYFDHPVAAGQTRFVNALNLALSPRFLPTLTLGATRKFHMYESDGFRFENVMDMFLPFQSDQLTDEDRERDLGLNQSASFYAHLLLPEANAELYGEFYREDNSWDWRDFFNQPHMNGGWAFGMQKIFFAPLADMYKVNLEITNLTITQIQQVRNQTYYYTHVRVRHGQTNNGQVLGAAIGPGSNSQFLSVDGYRGDYKFGMFIQRIAENETFHILRNQTETGELGDHFRNRVNLNLGLNALYSTGPLTLHGSLVWTKAYNYGRYDYGELDGIDVTNYERNDIVNIQLQTGVRYAF